MCRARWQGLDIMAMIKDMDIVEQILYDIRESNRRWDEGEDND